MKIWLLLYHVNKKLLGEILHRARFKINAERRTISMSDTQAFKNQ